MSTLIQGSRQAFAGKRGAGPRAQTEAPAERETKPVRSARPAYRILLVDRDSMSSDLLALALAREMLCEVTSVRPEDLLKALHTAHAELVIIASDPHYSVKTGFDLAIAAGSEFPELRIVMLLDQSSPDAVVNAFRSGARGVVSRQQPLSEFLACIQHVCNGCIWAGTRETGYLLDTFRKIPAPFPVTAIDSPALTERELQVVQCAARGKTNRVIAMELGLSEHTVKNYLSRAFEKLGVSSRIELLFYLTLRGHTFSPAAPEERSFAITAAKTPA